MQQRGGVYGAFLVQQHVPGLRHQVAGRAVREAALEASRRLVEQRPGVLLADRRIKRLQDLLQRDALGRVQRELNTARGRARGILAHHRASPSHHPSSLHLRTIHIKFIT